ncbi:unnamed protein product [Euphydryas editha]|uniref:Uncharacterized protein n=1 Tax=Euphydryas editha TaxID=104508 RepID=A0AAU9U2N0_EUPED|nr:unnamed protein product [Euphydryas editha]
MAPMTSAERQRKYREKLKEEDPAKLEKLKEENAERTKKKYKNIKQLPEFKQKEQRKNRNKKKEPNVNQTEESKIYQKQKGKVRYLLSKENLKLKLTIERMSKIIRAQKKTLYRYKKQIENLKESLKKTENEFENLRTLGENPNSVTEEATTPFSKTEKFIQEIIPNIPSPDKERVKKAIFENYVLKQSLSEQYSKAESKREKDVLKTVINNDIVTKYKLKTNLGYSCLGLKGRLRGKQRTVEKKV